MLEAAEPAVVGDPERLHRVGDLAAPVVAELVLLVGGQVHQLGDQDLAHLTGGAGHQRDPASLGDVARHRGALADRLVVRVSVDEEQALVGAVGHASSLGEERRDSSVEEGSVGLQPVHVAELVGGQPADLVVLGRAPARRRPATRRRPAAGSARRSAPRPASQPPTVDPHAELLRRSRGPASSASVSPGSTLPPGNSQRPAALGGRRTPRGQHAAVPDDRGADHDLSLHHALHCAG